MAAFNTLESRKALMEMLLKSILSVPFEVKIQSDSLCIYVQTKTPFSVYDNRDYFIVLPCWEHPRQDYYPPGHTSGTVCNPHDLLPWYCFGLTKIRVSSLQLKIDYNDEIRDSALLQLIEEIKRLSKILNE